MKQFWNFVDRRHVNLQELLQSRAERVFGDLDPDLAPVVRIVEVPKDPEGEPQGVLIEPPSPKLDLCGQELMETVRKELEQVMESFNAPFKEDPAVNEFTYQAIVGLIAQRLIAARDEARAVVSFCSSAAPIGDKLGIIVLELAAARVSGQHFFWRPGGPKSPPNSLNRSSLITAVVEVFMTACRHAASAEGSVHHALEAFPLDESQFIRDGASLLLTQLGALTVPKSSVDTGSLFKHLNSLSALRYEGAEAKGRLILCPGASPAVECLVTFTNSVPLSNYRACRKLLELSHDDICLLSDGLAVYGLGRVVENNMDLTRLPVFEVVFTGHYSWELCHTQKCFMQVEFGQPRFPKPRLSPEAFQKTLLSVFPSLDNNACDELWAVVEAASRQRHGTMVVVSHDAESEARRLQNQCTRVTPVKMSPNLMHSVTAIDGAVLLDTSATCHAIGVILDGLATEAGTPARGARYNSAIRYVQTAAGTATSRSLAIVISEDGSVDLIYNGPVAHKS